MIAVERTYLLEGREIGSGATIRLHIAATGLGDRGSRGDVAVLESARWTVRSVRCGEAKHRLNNTLRARARLRLDVERD